MKKIFANIALIAAMISFTGCGTVREHKTESGDGANQPVLTESQTESNTHSEKTGDSLETPNNEADSTQPLQADSNNKSIVVYYSRTGDNYSVGNITVGNTAKIANEIAKQSGADIFEITPVTPYPAVYKECTDVAKQELEDNARPAIATTVENFDQYNTVYLGYPIWWGDAPMIVYTFLENYNFENKTVITFNTHEGSGSAGTAQKIQKAIPKATVKEGIVMTGSKAQNDPDEVTKQVKTLLQKD